MSDGDFLIKSALEQVYPVNGEPYWEGVIAGAGTPPQTRRRQLVATLIAAGLLAIAFTTPLGAAISRSLDEFSTWISGDPGKPATQDEQEQFDRANARSWIGFPRGTRLRKLLTTQAGGTTVALYGFRSGKTTFCLKLKIAGASGAVRCAPIADLKRADAPARVLVADQPVGKGVKTAWYGLDRVHSAHLQITAGIAADSARAIILDDEQGRHRVGVQSNAFVYVAVDPEVGQRVKRVSALTPQGSVAVPFVPTAFGIGGIPRRANPPTAPVTAPLTTGRIRWLEQRDTRGAPLSVLPVSTRHGLLGFRGGGAGSRVLYGRVLTPDPSRPIRIVVTLNAHRHGGPPAGVCVYGARAAGVGGGCAPYPDTFADSPINFSSSGGGAVTSVQVTGVVADGVARLTALLENGDSLPVALRDNAFVGDVPTARLPARLVAYNAKGQVVGVSDPVEGFGMIGPRQLRGKATQLLAVKGAGGSHAELYVGLASGGGECSYLKTFITKRVAGMSVSCHAPTWQGVPLQLGLLNSFFYGRARPDIKRVRVTYEDGNTSTFALTRGYLLAPLAKAHLVPGSRPTRFAGIDRDGRVVASQDIPSPPPVPKTS
jgi:hypothetical protein